MEQIIKGVDVSGCDYISQDGRCEVQLALKRVNFECSQISDCLYKQLQRKTEECEKLKQFCLKLEYAKTEQHLQWQKRCTENHLEDTKQIDKLKNQLRRKELECEELKEYFKIKNFIRLEDGNFVDFVFTSSVIDEFVNENNRLKQALDEIENYCNHYDGKIFKDILQIIQKVKGE